jgi:hypothetical protein
MVFSSPVSTKALLAARIQIEKGIGNYIVTNRLSASPRACLVCVVVLESDRIPDLQPMGGRVPF